MQEFRCIQIILKLTLLFFGYFAEVYSLIKFQSIFTRLYVMAEKHFYEQIEFTKKYLLTYFQRYINDFHKLKVLEIGCAEGGLLEVLNEMGMDVTGIEINEERIKIAKLKNPNLKIYFGDITDQKITGLLNDKYDFIIMREVIEHIANKSAAFDNIDKLLKNYGYFFISFPPKYSPFAGHQQIAKSILKIFPYLHLLPYSILKSIAKNLGEKDDYVDEIKLHFSTGQTIKNLELHCALRNFLPIKKDHFLFRPIYSLRFGLPAVKVPPIPGLREIYSFGYETLLKKIPFNQ